MGKALYRKYRSKSLDEVIGQDHITKTLKNALKSGSISHAYLFTGPRGVGKTSVARILAHEVNNLPYTDESTHLDIIEIDAASNRRVDEIRELRDKIDFAPTSAKYKVYIIDEVHMLTKEAFNALLKTLEEPPEHAIFILATTEAHKVPETIISRTQRFQFKPISAEQTITHLRSLAEKEKIAIDDSALRLLAEHGSGSFRDSISMLDQVAEKGRTITEQDVRLLLGIPPASVLDNLLITITENNRHAMFTELQVIREQGIDAGQLAKALSGYLRQQLIDDQTRLPASTIISLLEDLLPLTSTAADYFQVEVILLKYCTTKEDKDIIPESSEQLSSRTDTSEQTNTPENEAKKDKNLIGSPKSTKKSVEEKNQHTPTHDWDALLKEIKKTHNTLYGLLRMSNVETKDNMLFIYFRFPFHKKQVDSPKYQQLLSNAVKQQYGDITYQTALQNNTLQTKVKTDVKVQNNSSKEPLQSISNIFGGAELLES